MSNIKISALGLVPSIKSGDFGVIVQNGITYKFQIDQLTDFTTTQAACRLGSTANLTATYNNGTAGIGATLINSGALAALSLDGVSVNVNDLVLIKDQSTQTQNGLYNVTNAGSVSVAWVLTRSTDYDQASDIVPGDFFTVASGTVNATTQWIQTGTVTAIGTDNITFASNIVAGTGITKTNNILSTSVVTASGTYTPTLTNAGNLTASTAYQCQYMQVGSVVTVSGQVDIHPTIADTTKLGISLPIASTFAASNNCGGVAFSPGIAGQGAAIQADSTNHRAQMQWVAVDTTNQQMYFSFTYLII